MCRTAQHARTRIRLYVYSIFMSEGFVGKLANFNKPLSWSPTLMLLLDFRRGGRHYCCVGVSPCRKQSVFKRRVFAPVSLLRSQLFIFLDIAFRTFGHTATGHDTQKRRTRHAGKKTGDFHGSPFSAGRNSFDQSEDFVYPYRSATLYSGNRVHAIGINAGSVRNRW